MLKYFPLKKKITGLYLIEDWVTVKEVISNTDWSERTQIKEKTERNGGNQNIEMEKRRQEKDLNIVRKERYVDNYRNELQR